MGTWNMELLFLHRKSSFRKHPAAAPSAPNSIQTSASSLDCFGNGFRANSVPHFSFGVPRGISSRFDRRLPAPRAEAGLNAIFSYSYSPAKLLSTLRCSIHLIPDTRCPRVILSRQLLDARGKPSLIVPFPRDAARTFFIRPALIE